MRKLLFTFSDLQIWMEEDGGYFALYDAGSHQVVSRKDAITEDEAKLACSGEKGAIQMLWSLQSRLKEAGVDPYSSNIR